MSRLKLIGAIASCALTLAVPLPERSCEKSRPANSSTGKSVASETTASEAKDEKVTDKVQTGVWGGQHIVMEVTESGAKITYDCAHGTIEQLLALDSAGRFDLRGTHVKEFGGPVRSDHKPETHPARYTGRANGKTITLTVTLTDTKETIGTFSLTHGEQPELTRCM